MTARTHMLKKSLLAATPDPQSKIRPAPIAAVVDGPIGTQQPYPPSSATKPRSRGRSEDLIAAVSGGVFAYLWWTAASSLSEHVQTTKPAFVALHGTIAEQAQSVASSVASAGFNWMECWVGLLLFALSFACGLLGLAAACMAVSPKSWRW
jgi:hypothetical protein